MAEFLQVAGYPLAMALIPVAVAWRFSIAPVPRERVARFARRQGLAITPDNGAAVIRYLATTRRWRAGCLVGAFQVFVVVPLVIDSWWHANALLVVNRVFDGPARVARTGSPVNR